VDSALARLSLRFSIFSLSIYEATGHHFSEAKALNVGDRRIVYWQKSIIYFPMQAFASLLITTQSLHRTARLFSAFCPGVRCASCLQSSRRRAILVLLAFLRSAQLAKLFILSNSFHNAIGVQVLYITESMVLNEIYKTKYDETVISGREKNLRRGFVLPNNTHHATIRKTGHTMQSIPE